MTDNCNSNVDELGQGESTDGGISDVLLNGLNALRQEGTFCDATLKVGERSIRVHKNVISASSLHFEDIILSSLQSPIQCPTLNQHQEIRMDCLTADILELLIDSMYTGMLNIDSRNVMEVLLTASYLQMTVAEKICCDFMVRELTKDTFGAYMEFSRMNPRYCLKDSLIEKAVGIFPQIFCSDEHLELVFEELKQLTHAMKGIEFPEDIIYSFAMRWINHSLETRKGYIRDVLELLDPSSISPCVLRSPKILKIPDPAFATWAEQATRDHEDYVLVYRRTIRARPIRVKLYSEVQHRTIEKLPWLILDGRYVCHGFYIYHQGGRNDFYTTRTDTYAYNQIKRKWFPFVPLQQARSRHGLCELNGSLFSVAGWSGVRTLQSVEFTDLHTGQRGIVNSLPKAKRDLGIGVHGNSIYVVGGNDIDNDEIETRYNCTHRLDVREGFWQELMPAPYRDGASSCAVVGDNIFTTHPDSLQRYDIRANNWERVSAIGDIIADYHFEPPHVELPYPREVFAFDNSLLGLFNDRISRFIHEEGTWETLRTWTISYTHEFFHVAPNLLFPNLSDEEIIDPTVVVF